MNALQEKFYSVITYFKAYIVIAMAVISIIIIIYACAKLIKTKNNNKNKNISKSKALVIGVCVLIILCSAGNLYNAYRTINPEARAVLLDGYSLTIINNQRYYEHSLRSLLITHLALIVFLFNRLDMIKNKGKLTT